MSKPRRKLSDQHRRKLSMSARGNKHSQGRVWSDESRAKLSAAMKGNRNSKGHSPSPEHRRKISEALKGKPNRPKGWRHTPEARSRIAASMKGKFAKPEERMNLRIAQQVIKLFRPDVHAKKARLSAERMGAQNQDPAFRAARAAAQQARRKRNRAPKATP